VKFSELQAILTKAATLVGDGPVIFKALEGEAVTFLHGIEVEITSAVDQGGSTLTITHTSTAPTVPGVPVAADTQAAA
jgi:hypothetical protein